MHCRQPFQKIQSLQRLQSKAEPLFDKKVRKTTPLHPHEIKAFGQQANTFHQLNNFNEGAGTIIRVLIHW